MKAELNERPCASCKASDYTPCYEVATDFGGLFHVVRCRDCGLVRLLESLTEKEYLELYVGGTTTIHMADELALKSYDRILGALDPFRQTGKLLEVGVGGGSFLRRAAERGWNCYGNDVSTIAFDPLYDVIPRDHLFRGHLQEAPFFEKLAPVDVCIMLGVLEHIPGPIELLSVLHDVLRPGGALFIDVPNYAALSRRVLGANWGMWDVPNHVSFFTPPTLEAVLGKAGFDVRRRWTSGFNPVDIGRILQRRRSKPGPTAGTSAPAVEAVDVDSEAYLASRVARRRRTERIRRIVSHLGPTKQIVNAGLDAISGGDSLYCLAARR